MATLRARRLEPADRTFGQPGDRRSDHPNGFHAKPPEPARMGPIEAACQQSSGHACSLDLSPAERSFLERSLAGLTRREREVVFALCSGGTNEGMAARLCIALPTLRTHLMRLNQKLGTASKGDVIRLVAAELLSGYRTRQILPGAPDAGA